LFNSLATFSTHSSMILQCHQPTKPNKIYSKMQ